MLDKSLDRIKQRVRLIQLLDSAERAGLTPIRLRTLHAFAYLADVLSPVWGLSPFQRRLAKTGRSPYFPDLQRELDALVGMGLIEVSDLDYSRPKRGERVTLKASFALRLELQRVDRILNELKAEGSFRASSDYLTHLANALSSLRDEDIEAAAAEDVSYSASELSVQDYVEISDVVDSGSRTQTAVAAFDFLFPATRIPPSRRLMMYAQYLGRRASA